MLIPPCLQAVKEALQIPVLANGNIRDIHDVDECLAHTGADGVMSADSLLEDPALFWDERRLENSKAHLEGCRLMLEYLDLWEKHPVPSRMVRGHTFKMLGKISPTKDFHMGNLSTWSPLDHFLNSDWSFMCTISIPYTISLDLLALWPY